MKLSKWWPYVAIGSAAVIVSLAYPIYFNWWDHRSCHDSGGQWNESADECIEPEGANIPHSEGSATYEDDNQGGGARPRE
jgi:hypothetical protein